MKIRTRLLVVIVLINLAVAMAGVVILPSLSADRDAESHLTGRVNRVSMSVVLEQALFDLHREADAIELALEHKEDVAPARARLVAARGALLEQLRFLPVRDAPALRKLRDDVQLQIATLDARLAAPLDLASARLLAADIGQLYARSHGELLGQLQRDNQSGLAGASGEFARLRHRLAVALGAVLAALALTLVLSVFAYRRFVRPLGAVSHSLGAVLTGRAPSRLLAETNDEFGDIVRAMCRLQAQAEHIRRIAFVDPGSGMPNRNSLDAELREVRRLRPIDGSHGLILIGIETYASVRSGFGARLAEAMMRSSGERLLNLDALPTQAYRIDGDVFAVLVDRGQAEAVTRADLKRITAEALSRLSRAVDVEEQSLKLLAAAGAAIFPDDARDPEEYINVAMEALRQARGNGVGQLSFGERGHTHRLRRHLALTEQIRSGIRQGQFMPYFQPIVDITQRKVVGAETLVRWRQPDGRVTMPSEFIFIAEGSDLIADMTRDVLTRACMSFRTLHAAGSKLRLSFNLSPKMLTTNVMEVVREALRLSSFDPAYVSAEVTETVLVRDLEHTGRVLKDLSALGIRLSLDDFGTGFSSLQHLYHFDISTIKIDPTIMRAATQNRRAQEIVRSMVQLSTAIDVQLIVEGIETDDDVRLMQKLGARYQQGFYFSRAMPEEQFAEWVRAYEAGILAA